MTATPKPPTTPFQQLRRAVGRIPILGRAARAAWIAAHEVSFRNSSQYWKSRYSEGGNSGPGSYGRLAQWKAETINKLVAERKVQSVIEFGCGDGDQLRLASYPQYIGLDIAPAAIRSCIQKFGDDASKSFFAIDTGAMSDRLGRLRSEMSLSLDVLYHLVEDEVRDSYLTLLFDSATRHVVIYSSNGPLSVSTGVHERHRAFTPWVQENRPDWNLEQHIPNPYPARTAQGAGDETSPSDFFIYSRR